MTTNTTPKFNFTTSYAEAVVPVGTVHKVYNNGQTRKYVFVLNAGADAIAAGDAVSCFSVSSFTFGSVSVTAATIADLTDGTTTRALAAGVAGAAATLNEYLWLWFSGYGTHSIPTDTNIAIYQSMKIADGAKVVSPNATEQTAHHANMGISLAADSSTALTKAFLGGPAMFPWDG